MPGRTPEQETLVGQIRHNSRRRPELADQQREELRALSAERRIQEIIQEIVDKAPPLSAEQVARLRPLLSRVTEQTGDAA